MKFNRNDFPKEYEIWSLYTDKDDFKPVRVHTCDIYLSDSPSYYLSFSNYRKDWNTLTHDIQDRILAAINALLKTNHEFV